MGSYQMPWYLRLYSWLAPKRAAPAVHLDRLHRDADYRDAHDLYQRLRSHGGYNSAKSSFGQTPWGSTGNPRSADTEVLFDLPRLRERSREAKRNDPIASGLLRNFVNDVVGTGITPQSTADARDEIEAHWRDLQDDLCPADTLDWTAFQRMLYGKMLEDGEVLVHRVIDAGRVTFEIVEADRLGWPQDAWPADPDGSIRDGVERDPRGRVIAYWIMKRHPGDVHLPRVNGHIPRPIPVSKADFVRVPVADCYHLKLIDRPGQSRGVPLLAPVLQNLRDLDLLLEASIKRSQIAACLAAFITSENASADMLNFTARDDFGELDHHLNPGMMFRLFPGESVTSFSPPGEFPNMDVFVVMLARRIGAALGISWQLVLKDFSQANYSSARTDLLEARKTFRAHQQMLIACLRWVWRSVIEVARLRGDLRINREDVAKVRFQPAGYEWVDPQKEAMAAKLELEIGLTTLRDLAAERGRDWEDLKRQRALELQMDEELGLPALGVAETQTEPQADEETEPASAAA